MQTQQNVRSNGLGMGETVQVSSGVSFGDMVLMGAITAGMTAVAAIIVEGVKYYWFRGDDDGVVLRSENGMEVKFKSIKDAENARDELEELIKKAKKAAEKKEEEEEEKAKEKKDAEKTEKKEAA